MKISAIIMSLLLALPTQPAQAQSFLELAGLSPYTKYKTFETEHFTLTYAEGYFEFTKRAAIHLEHAHKILSPLLKWSPRYKTSIVVVDNEDDANGFTMPALRVGIVLIATPPDAWFPTSYTDDWIKLLTFHEYTHMLNIDATTKWMEVMRWVFGDVIRPNGLWPVWMLEGLAVYFETRTSHFGRGRSPYWDSVLRAFVNENRLGNREDFGITLDRVNGDYPYFPGGEIAYLFGYEMWNRVPEKFMGEYSLRSSHRVPYFIEGNLKGVTGQHWNDYWQTFVDETKTRMGTQITEIKKQGETQYQQITQSKYSALGGMISPNGKLLAFTQTSLTRTQGLYIQNLETHELNRIDDKVLGLGLGFTPDSRFLIASSLQRSGYQTYSDLFAYDLVKNKSFQLTRQLRAKDPHVSPDGKHLTFIQVSKGSHLLKSAELLIDGDGKPTLGEPALVYEPQAFSIIGSPHFMDNHKIIFSLQEIGKGQSDLYTVDINGKNLTRILSDGKMNRYPFSIGEDIYFVSDLTGIENIYTLDGKRPLAITNLITGAIAPFMAPSGELYSSVMTSNGYEIANFGALNKVKTKRQPQSISAPPAPESLTAALHSPELNIQETSSNDYSFVPSMVPREWSPLAYTYYDARSGVSFGGLALGFDSTGKHQYSISSTYNTKSETLDANINYSLYEFRPKITVSGLAQTTAIATDTFGAYYQRNYETALAFDYPAFWTYSQLSPRLYGYIDWNSINSITTHERTPSDDYEFSVPYVPGIGASITYSKVESSKLAITPEEGYSIGFTNEMKFNTPAYPIYKYLASFTSYFRLGGEHSILQPTVKWLGSSHLTDKDNSYALIQGRRTTNIADTGQKVSLGGIGLRGYSDMSFYTRSSGVMSLDYNFPIDQIFGGYHTLPFFLKQVHGFTFVETAFIPNTLYGSLFLPAFGGGISLDTTLFIRIPLTVSFEMQKGTRTDLGGDQTFFFSLASNGLF